MILLGLLAAALLGTVGAAAPPRPLPGVPGYTAGYRSWFKLNAKPIPVRPGGDAHSGTKNIYASRRKVGTRYPAGTIIVKEATRPGKRFLGLIAVMRKIKGFSPRNNDWQMIEYTRSTPTERFAPIASGSICYSCHVGARSFDYVCSATKRDVCPP